MLDVAIQRRQRARNVLHEGLLIGCLIATAAGVAWLLFGLAGLVVMLVVGALFAVVRPRLPARAVLSAYRAMPLPYTVAPGLHDAVEVLAGRAGLASAPALFLVPSRVPNAFGVGGDVPVLALTDGLLRTLDGRELVGVLAHEISHLRSGDTTVMTFSAAIARFTQNLAFVGILALVFGLPLAVSGTPTLLAAAGALLVVPFVVAALELAFSRSREFDADLGAARLTGDPEGLALGLEDLERATRSGWDEFLFPRGRHRDPWLLRTHPATVERARRLRALEVGTAGWPPCRRPE